MSDNRSYFTHKIHQWGHEYNAYMKRHGYCGIETTKIYKSKSPKKYRENGWDVSVDDRRAEYHRQKASEKDCIII